MRLPEEYFVESTLDYIEDLLDLVKDHKLDLETMPPSFSIVKDYELTKDDIALEFTTPQGLPDTPDTWEEPIRKEYDLLTKPLGFIFWCFVESPKEEGSRFLFRFVKQKGDDPKGFISDLNCQKTSEVNPLEVVPQLKFLLEF